MPFADIYKLFIFYSVLKLKSPVLYPRNICNLFWIKVNIFFLSKRLYYISKQSSFTKGTKRKIFLKQHFDDLVFFLKNHCKKDLKSHKILSRATYYFSLYLILEFFSIFWSRGVAERRFDSDFPAGRQKFVVTPAFLVFYLFMYWEVLIMVILY